MEETCAVSCGLVWWMSGLFFLKSDLCLTPTVGAAQCHNARLGQPAAVRLASGAALAKL